MTLRLALIFAATALASGGALAQERGTAPKDAAASPSPPAEAKAAVESCAARKFETIVVRTVDGKMRGSKVKLCGKEGQSDAEWANTLKDAIKKVEANATMPQASKDQLIVALNIEISKIESGKSVAGTPPVVSTLPVASALPRTAAPPAERPPEYSTLPPLPTAPAVATKSTLAPPGPPPRKPRLTIQCYTPGEIGGGGPCISLERDTLMTVRADENLASGAFLRFLRRGDFKGEVALAQMRKGQSRRFKLPQPLCSGVSSSKVEIQILGRAANGTGTSRVADTLGPYQLRC